MQQRLLISGFSEFKDLLIKKYNITEERDKIRLYFSKEAEKLVLHNYKQHHQQIILAEILPNGVSITIDESSFAWQLIDFASKENRPAHFLNHQFNLHGFFRF